MINSEVVTKEETKSKESDPHNWDYPCIGVSEKGRVVLFSEYGKGFLIKDNGDGQRLHYSDLWSMDHFTLLSKDKVITLSNA